MARLGRAQPFPPHHLNTRPRSNWTSSFTELLTVTDTNYFPPGDYGSGYFGGTYFGGDPWDIILFSKQTVKNPSETVTLSERFNPGGLFRDSVTVTETFTKSMSRLFSEALTLVEAFAKLDIKAFLESLSLSETRVNQDNKAASDTVNLTETFTKVATLQRLFSETLTVVEVFIKSLSRAFSESLTSTDSITKLTTKQPFSESLTTSDSGFRQPMKLFVEGLLTHDQLDSPKVFDEFLTITEVIAKFISKKPFTDGYTVSDSGSRMTVKAAIDKVLLNDYGDSYPWLGGMDFGIGYFGGAALFLPFYFRLKLTRGTRDNIRSDFIVIDIIPERLYPNLSSEKLNGSFLGEIFSGSLKSEPITPQLVDDKVRGEIID